MTLSSIFSAQLPLGRIALLAWLTATFLNLKWGIEIAIRDVEPVEFVLQAGFLFGYYIALMFFIRLALLIPVAIISSKIAISFHANEIQKNIEGTNKPSDVPENWFRMDREKDEKKSSNIYTSLAISNLRRSSWWKKFQKRLFDIVANLADVIAMVIAFIIYTEKNLEILAPIGILISLVLFIFGGFDESTSHGTSDNEATG